MIRATARPGLIVFCRNPVGIRHQSFRTGEVLQETIASIRILHRVDDHNGIVQDLRCPCITTRSQQVVGGQHRGVGRGNLVAVHAIRQPGNGRLVSNDLLGFGPRGHARVRDALHACLDVVDTRHVVSRGDDGVDEVTTLPGRCVTMH